LCFSISIARLPHPVYYRPLASTRFLLPSRKPLQPALLSPDVVGSEAVIAASLDVECGEVHAKVDTGILKINKTDMQRERRKGELEDLE
jgi:hypothetical protein